MLEIFFQIKSISRDLFNYWSWHLSFWAGFKMGNWFVPAQPRTKPGLSPIPPNVPSWCRVSWLLKGLAWRMALSCHSQANHRGRGSDAIRHTWFLDLLPSDPQRWGALSVACHPGCRRYLSLCLPFGHALLLVSQLVAVYHLFTVSFFFLHLTPLIPSVH